MKTPRMGTFRPFRLRDLREWQAQARPDPELERATREIASALIVQGVADALDSYPADGALTVRDATGRIWEVRLAPSDVTELRGERDFKTKNQPPR